METYFYVGIVLSIIVFVLVGKEVYFYFLYLSDDSFIRVENNTINFSELSVRQKLGQMFFVRGKKNKVFAKFAGGIFLDSYNKKEKYKEVIGGYSKVNGVDFFIATDLEGAWNPFSSFYNSESFLNVKDPAELGEEHGKILKELGFNMNFAPVAENVDNAYGGRVFSGDIEEKKKKLRDYIGGLQKNVSGVCKHYPGKGMVGNLHIKRDMQVIEKEDLQLFDSCFDSGVVFVMIGHQIAKGELDSGGRPSSVSKGVLNSIPEDVLIISDDVNMLGLRSFYFYKKQIYKDMINSGVDMVLDVGFGPFKEGSFAKYKILRYLEKEVEKGEIDIEEIDKAVKKILRKKGYQIKI